MQGSRLSPQQLNKEIMFTIENMLKSMEATETSVSKFSLEEPVSQVHASLPISPARLQHIYEQTSSMSKLWVSGKFSQKRQTQFKSRLQSKARSA
jgi:hypothetical protein